MKSVFVKNLYFLLTCLLLILVCIPSLLTCLFVPSSNEGNLALFICGVVVPGLPGVILGFYFAFQRIVVDEYGITVRFFKKTMKRFAWNEIEKIYADSWTGHPTLSIATKDGRKICVDKRKKLAITLEYYSKTKIIGYNPHWD